MSRKAEQLARDLAVAISARVGLTKAAGGSLYGALLPVAEEVARQQKAARRRHREVKKITKMVRALAYQGVTPAVADVYRRHSDAHMAALHAQHAASRLEPWTPPGPSAVSHANGHSLPTVGRTDGRADTPPGHPG